MMRLTGNREKANLAVHRAVSGLSAADLPSGGRACLTLVGNLLTIVGADSSTEASVAFDVDGESDGSVCVESGRLAEFLQRAMPDEIHISENAKGVRLRSGATSLTLPLLEGEVRCAFPPKTAERIEIPGAELALALRRVLLAVHESQDCRPLCGVHIANDGGRFLAEATNGQRISRAFASQLFPHVSAIVSSRFAAKLADLADREDKISLRFANQRVWADVPGTRLVGLTLHGSFPPLRVDEGKILASGQFETDDLLNRLSLLRIVDEHAWLKLLIGHEKLKLVVRGDGGAVEATVDCNTVVGTASTVVALHNLRVACQAIMAATVTLSVVRVQDSTFVRLASEDGLAAWQLACRAD